MRWERRGPIPAAAARSAQCAAAERTAETEAGSNFLPSPSKPAPRPRYTTGDGFQIDSKVLPGSAALGHPHQLPVSPKRAGGCTAHREEVSAPGRQRCAVQSAKRGGGAPRHPHHPPRHIPAPHLRAAPRGRTHVAGHPARRRAGLLHGHVRAAHGRSRGRPAPPPPSSPSSSSSSSSARGGRGGAPRSADCQSIFGGRRVPRPHL